MWNACLISCLLLVNAPPTDQDTSVARDTRKEKVYLRHFIYRAAEEAKCFVTIEALNPDSTDYRVDVEVEVPKVRHLRSADDLAKMLRPLVPGRDVVVEDTVPPLIHIIDPRLHKHKDYCLDQLATSKYQGHIEGFPNALGKSFGGNLRSAVSGFVGMGLIDDWITTVDCRCKDRSVRKVLSDYVPFACYSRIIWEAQSYVEGSRLITRVRYFGPEIKAK